MFTIESNYNIKGGFSTIEEARRYAEARIQFLCSEKYVSSGEKMRLMNADTAAGDDIVLIVDDDDKEVVEVVSIPDVMGWETYSFSKAIDTIGEVQALVEREYLDFQDYMLKLSPKQIYDECYQIHVKQEIHAVIMESDCLSNKCFERMAEHGDGLLEFLFIEFISNEYASVNTFSDTAEFIESTMREWAC